MGKCLIRTLTIILLLSFSVFAEFDHSSTILMAGTAMETEIHISDSGKAGPTAVIIGGIHGDETAGVLAAEAIAKLAPVCGRIIVVPRANRPACDSGVRTEYYMDDLNRCFPGASDKGPAGYAAASLTEAVKAYEPSIVIDLHESRYKYGEGEGSLGQSLVISEQGDSASIVLDIIDLLNTKTEAENQFTFTSGAPAGSLNNEISKLLDIPAVTVETWSGRELETRVKDHINAVSVILEHFKMLEQ